jgi:hypothetical protein
MKDRAIHLFPHAELPPDHGHFWSFPEPATGLLALAFYESEQNAIAFTLLDLNTSTLLHNTRISVYGTHVVMLYLACNAKQDLWAIAALVYDGQAYDYRLKLYLLSQEDKGKFTMSEPISIEQEDNDNLSTVGGIHALVVDNTNRHMAQVVYERDWVDNIDLPILMVKQVDLATFTIQEFKVDYFARLLICRRPSSVMILSAHFSNDYTRKYIWRVYLSNSKYFTGKSDWASPVGLHLTLANPQRESFSRLDERIIITAKIIADAPFTEWAAERYIVGMAMVQTAEKQSYGYIGPVPSVQKTDSLLYIDASGNIVQQCTSTVGLYIDLCCCEQTVVGVDLQEPQWRLWNWQPLRETKLHQVMLLPEDVIRASVVANHSHHDQGSDLFWLIEEYRGAICVTRRNAQTLEEVDSPIFLPDVHLLLPQFGPESLDWHVYQEAASYRNTLLMLVADDHEQLIIHEIS